MGNSARKYSRENSDSLPKPEVLIEAFRKLLRPHRAWVLFQNGTAVISPLKDGSVKTKEQMENEAVSFMKENGMLIAGTPLGDFNSIYNSDLGGWIITFHTERLLTFVPGEEKSSDPSEGDLSLSFGLLGRMLRQKDSRELRVIYVHKP